MGSVYGSQWSRNYGDVVDKVWRQALSKIPYDRLKLAVARCPESYPDFLPKLPQFIKLAQVRPEEHGWPSFDSAWKEAVNLSYQYGSWRKWSHDAVYTAAVKTGRNDISERGEKMRKQFDKEYQLLLDDPSQVIEQPKGEIAKKREVVTQEEGLAHCAELKRMLAKI